MPLPLVIILMTISNSPVRHVSLCLSVPGQHAYESLPAERCRSLRQPGPQAWREGGGGGGGGGRGGGGGGGGRREGGREGEEEGREGGGRRGGKEGERVGGREGGGREGERVGGREEGGKEGGGEEKEGKTGTCRWE